MLVGAYRYPKAARIRRRREFLRLQRSGQRRHTAHLVLIRSSASLPLSRLGVTASKKIGNAVVRNRIKRMIREAFRHLQRDVQPPADLVVIAKPDARNLTYALAAAELASLLRPRPGA